METSKIHSKEGREHGLNSEAMQFSSPSLPYLRVKQIGRKSRLTSHWRWLLRNRLLVCKVITKYGYGGRFSNCDIISTFAPCVLKALRKWKREGGASRTTFVFHAIRNHLALVGRRLYPVRGDRRAKGYVRPPLLLGNREPEPNDEWKKDVEPDDDLLASLRAAMGQMNDRRKTVLRLWLGLDGGGRRTMTETAADLGISKERVSQLIETAIQTMRDSLGVKTSRPLLASTCRNGGTKLSFREYQDARRKANRTTNSIS